MEGLLTIYSLTNIAANGLMPKESLVKIEDAYYEERNSSYSRIYSAMGANHQFDKLVRCFNTTAPSQGMYVILEDNCQYQIDICQTIKGKDCIDLTLVKVEDYYDVINGPINESQNEPSGD